MEDGPFCSVAGCAESSWVAHAGCERLHLCSQFLCENVQQGSVSSRSDTLVQADP